MDPLTAGLNLATILLQFGMKVFDATPQPLQAQSAADWATFTHNISGFLVSLQDKINAAIKVTP